MWVSQIESCGGPAIVASSVFALNIQSNYFEDNNAGTNLPIPNSSHYNLTFKDDPAVAIEVPSDIALGVDIVNLWWTRASSPLHLQTDLPRFHCWNFSL